MPTVNVRDVNGVEHAIDAPDGVSLMEAAVQNGIAGIWAQCGGAASCATCHVYVDPSDMDAVGTYNEIEDDMLDGILAERRPTSRLSCQIRLSPDLDGLSVEVAPEE